MVSEASVIEYLVKEYNAQAIVLHGSRADGTYKENSDWDLFVLTDVPTRSDICEFQGQALDIGIIPLPVNEGFIRTYIYSLINARVLLDTKENVARNAVQKANYLYTKGYRLSELQLMDRQNALDRNCSRLQTTVDKPEYFLFYLGNMYRRALTVWFEVRGLWPQSVVKYALIDIQESDPEYYDLLLRLSSNETSLQEKVSTAAEIYDLLFTE